MGTEQPQLERYVTQLLAELGELTVEEQRFSIQLYRRLAQGQPVAREQLAITLHMSHHAVNEALREIASFAEFDKQGKVTEYGGLSLAPTQHHFQVDGHTLYTWCAWDSLFIPAIINNSAQVESTCPQTEETIRLTVTPAGIEHVDPPGTVISFATPDFGAFRGNVKFAFCDWVHFFSSPAAGVAWVADHPGPLIVTLDEAYRLGQVLNRGRLKDVLAVPA